VIGHAVVNIDRKAAENRVVARPMRRIMSTDPIGPVNVAAGMAVLQQQGLGHDVMSQTLTAAAK
jgi:hypothetical protein